MQNFGSSRRPQGASTITQQVAKNFLLTNEVSYTRKIKEALLALKIERTYSKDKILELYLNEIYLGLGAYGIAAASLVYFDKSVNELTVRKSPIWHRCRRRRTTITRSASASARWSGATGSSTAWRNPASSRPPTPTRPSALRSASRRRRPACIPSPPNISPEEVRRELFERYGEKKLYEGGLSVRTTLDTKLQVMARQTLIDGLVRFDENQGWRGPVTKIADSNDWGVKLADVKALADIAPWRLAVVLDATDQSARIGLQPGRDPGGYVSKERAIGIIPLDGVKWAKSGGKP